MADLTPVQDQGLTSQLESMWKAASEGAKQYLTESPEQRAQREAQAEPTTATPRSQYQSFMAGQDPRGEYSGSSYPGEPKRELIGGLRSGLGTALQVGSAFIPPLLAGSAPIRAMQAGGMMSRIGAKAIPTMMESGAAMAGSAIGGGTSGDVEAAGLLPIGMRMVGTPVSRVMGKALAESVMPDQVRNAAMLNMEKRFGPAIMPKTLWEEHINPNRDLWLPSPATEAFLKKMDMPSAITISDVRLKRDLTTMMKKYMAPDMMRGRQMTMPQMGGVFGLDDANARTLGNMYDDMRQLDTLAARARESKLGNYAQQIMGLKEAMLNDMVKAVPKLADARTATWKQGNVSRLWEVMRSGKPIDDWEVASRDTWVQKAFNKGEMEDIKKTMEQMARLGGGEHWVGRILGHAALGGLTGAIGMGVGGPAGAAAGGALGVLMPHVLGMMMANAGGRAYMRGLMKKYPTGMTAAAANSAMQWFLAAQRTGTLQEFGGAGSKFDFGQSGQDGQTP